MKNSERVFYFFDVEVVSGVPNVQLPRMSDLVAVWERYVNAGTAQMAIRTDTAFLMIGGLQFDAASNIVSMLIRLSDSQAPNPVTSNIQRGTFTEHVKGADDGNDVGAHIMISTLPERAKPNVYCAIVEDMRGLSYREMRQILNKVLHFQYRDDVAVFTVADPRGRRDRHGQPKQVPHLPRLEMRGHPSQTLQDDVERGSLSGVTLVKAEAQTPVAGTSYLTKKRTELKLAIDHQNLPANLWNSLTNSVASMAGTYPFAKISFKLPNQPRAVTVEIESQSGLPVDEIYIRSFRLTGINPLLAASSRAIVPHLVDLARPHLLNHRAV